MSGQNRLATNSAIEALDQIVRASRHIAELLPQLESLAAQHKFLVINQHTHETLDATLADVLSSAEQIRIEVQTYRGM